MGPTDVYFADYEATLAHGLPSVYHVEDSWENYHKIASVIDDRFSQWQRGSAPIDRADVDVQRFENAHGLTREEMLTIAAEVWEGKRPESDLQKYGVRLGEVEEGDDARERLLDELADLGVDLRKDDDDA